MVTIWRFIASTGKSTPAIAAISLANGPAAFTTDSQEIKLLSVATAEIFPASNCDRDMIGALRGVMGWEVVELWHKEAALPEGIDVIALPGGFSYGDYLRSGAIARFSPVMISDMVTFFAN